MRVFLNRLALLFVSVPLLAFEVEGLRPVAPVVSLARDERSLTLHCSDGSLVRISPLTPGIVRVRATFSGQPAEPGHSWAIAKEDWKAFPWTFSESAEAIVISTGQIEVRIKRDPLLIDFVDPQTGQVINADQRPLSRDPVKGRVAAFKKFGFDEHFYGLGEKAARLDKRRGRFVQWNSDTPGYVEGTDPIYQSVPFYMGLENGRAYGLFYDNSHRSEFDLGFSGQEYAGFCAEAGEIDYYFFAGPSMRSILASYTELTGRMPMPPLWSLGNQQCRYSYYPDSLVEKVVRTFREKDLPLDVMYLDIHYMDGYRSFTWDRSRFPDPKGLMERLAKEGVRVVTIVDPGIKYQPVPNDAPAESRYSVFDQGLAKDYFLRRKDGSLYLGEVWPGKAVFVDYTKEDARRWWGDLHGSFLDAGVAGFWNDMNEPSDFLDKSGATQADVVFDDRGKRTLYGRNRNTFALNMARATYEGLLRLQPDRRPFIVTRAGYAGIQRYATMWTGDNNATWDSLALSIPMFASLGLSGEAFVGSDVPGFIGRGDAELLARSYQIASLVPLCRNHAAVDVYDHEPWRYGTQAEGIVRKYLKLRYALLPFLYTTLEEAHRTGLPLFRAPLINYQEDSNFLNMDDQFMVGDALLAAPVVRAGERGREVYLPSGLWYDFWSGRLVEGGTSFRVEAPLDHLPLYVRGGSIIPSTEPMQHTGEKPWDPLRFDIYPDQGNAASGSLYEDDGLSQAYLRGVYRRTRLSFSRKGAVQSLELAAAEGSYSPPARSFELRVHGQAGFNKVLLDGRELPAVQAGEGKTGWWQDRENRLCVRLTDDSKPHTLTFER